MVFAGVAHPAASPITHDTHAPAHTARAHARARAHTIPTQEVRVRVRVRVSVCVLCRCLSVSGCASYARSDGMTCAPTVSNAAAHAPTNSARWML